MEKIPLRDSKNKIQQVIWVIISFDAEAVMKYILVNYIISFTGLLPVLT